MLSVNVVLLALSRDFRARSMRVVILLLAVFCVAGCSTFPGSVEEGVVDIKDVTAAIECELAAVAGNPQFANRKIPQWNALADLDLTLARNLSADGKVTVTAPYALATLSATPSLSVAGTDTSIAHIEFAPSIGGAMRQFGKSCLGMDPSETKMGLAVWFESALLAVQPDELAGVTYTKQFEIVVTAGSRFGYTLIPVTNSVSLDAGGGGTRDYTNRISVAMTPPSIASPPKPIPVYIVTPAGKQKLEPNLLSAPAAAPASSTATRSLNDPLLLYLLQRKAPVNLGR